MTMTDPDLAAAWDELHAANTLGWQVGRAYLHDERGCWEQYAFDPKEKPRVGKRAREWTAIGPTEVECVREMAYWLRGSGRGSRSEMTDRLDGLSVLELERPRVELKAAEKRHHAALEQAEADARYFSDALEVFTDDLGRVPARMHQRHQEAARFLRTPWSGAEQLSRVEEILDQRGGGSERPRDPSDSMPALRAVVEGATGRTRLVLASVFLRDWPDAIAILRAQPIWDGFNDRDVIESALGADAGTAVFTARVAAWGLQEFGLRKPTSDSVWIIECERSAELRDRVERLIRFAASEERLREDRYLRLLELVHQAVDGCMAIGITDLADRYQRLVHGAWDRKYRADPLHFSVAKLGYQDNEAAMRSMDRLTGRSTSG